MINDTEEVENELMQMSNADERTISFDNKVNTFSFACRTCRTVLFSSSALESHVDKIVETVQEANHSNPHCSSWFLQEPTSWMECSDLLGKLSCPNERCKAKLGSWNWSGSRCSCGQWITPAFQFQKSRLDAKHNTHNQLPLEHATMPILTTDLDCRTSS
mmetsp:Transcript_11150/g.11174  ORF Transcript_11150/g.11174 Transcript_11150/m.11174 type:complete len:160 (+) Transcript_11150:73-552(+)